MFLRKRERGTGFVLGAAAVIFLAGLALTGCGGGGTGGSDGPPPPPPSVIVHDACVFPAGGSGPCWPYAVAGQGAFTVQIDGEGFANSSVVQWNGMPLPAVSTGFSGSSSIFASVSAPLIAAPGKSMIAVVNGSVTSNAVEFQIASPATLSAGVVQAISLAPDGSPANGDSVILPSISPTGRFVAFQSSATNLAPGPASGYGEIYERDTCLGAPSGCIPSTVRISVTYDGSPVNFHSRNSAISADGRYVAFDSDATNILPGASACGGPNGTDCVYLRDTCTGAPSGCVPTTIPISVDTQARIAPGSGPQITPDGRFVSFASVESKLGMGSATVADMFLRDTCIGAPAGCAPSTRQVSFTSDGGEGDSLSRQGDISSNARFVAFYSNASNMAPGEANPPGAIWRDTCLGAAPPCTPTTVRADVTNDGAQPNSDALFDFSVPISANGRFVAFGSGATNLVSVNVNGNCPVFQGNGCSSAYVHDTCAGAPTGCTPTPSLVSLANDGALENCSSPGNVGGLSMSADGRFIDFGSIATNLSPDDTFPACGWEDIFVRDTCFGVATGCTPSTVRVSVANAPNPGISGNASSAYSAISADGHYVVFVSPATNLLPGTPGNGHALVWLAKTGF